MEQYVRSDGIQSEAIQFKGVEESGNDKVFDLLTLIEQHGMKGVWEPVRHTDEWVENEVTGEPEEVIIRERIMLFGTTTSIDENDEVVTEIVELVPVYVGDYLVRRDGDLYAMPKELFEFSWSSAITTDVDDWDWITNKRLTYSSKTGYWQHKKDEDIVSTDGGLTYFKLSERPRYSLHGPVYRSVTKMGVTQNG